MKEIYDGVFGFCPMLGYCDDPKDRFYGWIFARHPDSQWVSLAKIPAVQPGPPKESAPLLQPRLDRANLSHALAEFYYLHAYDQNQGVGLTAAHKFLDKHPAGKWLSQALR